MAICDKCLHNEVCKYGERRSNGIYCSGEDCLQFKDRTKWITRIKGNWIAGADGSYMCPVCSKVFRYEIGFFCSECGAELKME